MRNKSKTKNRRIYNVFLNTHTVSGIVISVGLYVIFFAGAFALFQNSINNWEFNYPEKSISPSKVDYDLVLEKLKKENYELYGRDILIDLRHDHGTFLRIFSRPPRNLLHNDSLLKLSLEDSLKYSKSIAPINKVINVESYEFIDNNSTRGKNSGIGRLMTELHYFAQIPRYGIYISGFVSLFFLFAIITGTIVHWKNIIPKFFTFRIKGSIKNLWTDAHTALGILGVPFQFMYAVTGTLFGLGLVILPFSLLVYGNPARITEILLPEKSAYELLGKSDKQVPITPIIKEVFKDVPDESISSYSITIKSNGDKNAHLTTVAYVDNKYDFSGKATSIHSLTDGKLVKRESYKESSFRTASYEYYRQLHFGSFGGTFVKSIYFLLALLTCFVIITGVMVWLTAREKKKYTHKLKFNRNVGAIYLGISLGLFPAIAVLFIIAKLLTLEIDNRFDIINCVFFGFWLAYSIYGFVIKDNFRINKHALLLTGILGLTIPIINGSVSGLWFWKSLGQGYPDSFLVDIGWLLLGSISLFSGISAKRLATKSPERKRKDKTKGPIPEEV